MERSVSCAVRAVVLGWQMKLTLCCGRAGVGSYFVRARVNHYSYDSLIAKHHTLSGIHSQTQFLPWHRWYILQYENLLRRTTGGKCLTVPYWPVTILF
jgi:hypothetical protein